MIQSSTWTSYEMSLQIESHDLQLTASGYGDNLPTGWLDLTGSFPKKKRSILHYSYWQLCGLTHAWARRTPVYLLYIQKAGCSHPSQTKISRRHWAGPTRWTCYVWFWRSVSSYWFSAKTNNNKQCGPVPTDLGMCTCVCVCVSHLHPAHIPG